MGANSRRRRAARKRERASERTGGRPEAFVRDAPADGRASAFTDPFTGLDDRAAALNLVAWLAGELQSNRPDVARLVSGVAGMRQRIDGQILSETIREWLGHLVASAAECHWTPTDLLEIVRRRGKDRQVPALAALLATETDRHPDDRVSEAWRDDLARLPAPQTLDLRSVSGLETVLGLAAVFIRLPSIEQTIPPPGSRSRETAPSGSASSSKHLTRVRALLAKAESTESSEEAEALSGKAQELISRHALDRLLHEPAESANDHVTARRIWIDAPYVSAKATLVNEIAGANRCRAVFSESLGFISVVGERGDLDAVELMTASLLVQAQAAMLAHGSHTDGWGTSRTRSFRQSFLIAYAGRIGERLRAATDEAAADTGEQKALVPVLRRRAEQVDAACEAMFPSMVKSKGASITNGHGFAAGRAAADLASLDAHPNLTAAAR